MPIATASETENLLELLPGKMVDVQINHPVNVRFKVPLVGYDLGNYILLKYPNQVSEGSFRDVLIEGNVVVVRYILEGSHGQCCAFRSTIRYLTKYPEKLIVLSYPKKIENRELRMQQRHVIHLPASIALNDQSTDEELTIKGIISDISTKGCGFIFKADNKKVNVKKLDIVVSIQNPTGGEILINARVCNSRNESGKVNVGIEFFDGDKQVLELLGHLFIDTGMM